MLGAQVVNHSKYHSVIIKGDVVLPDGTILKAQVYRLGPGQSSISLGMIDVDNIYIDGAPIEGYKQGYSADISDGESYEINGDGNGGLKVGLGGSIFSRNRWEKEPAAAHIDERV